MNAEELADKIIDEWDGEGNHLIRDIAEALKSERAKALREAAEPLGKYMHTVASLIAGRKPSWEHIGHDSREYWRIEAEKELQKELMEADGG